MSVHHTFYWSSRLLAVCAAVGLFATTVHAGDPVDVSSKKWDTEGEMKVKFDGEKEETLVTVTLIFGPRDDLAANEYKLTVDDGGDLTMIKGTYTEEKEGKPELALLDDELLAALELSLEEEGIEIDLSGKLKAKAKQKDGQDLMKLKFKMKAKVTVEFDGESESAKMKVVYKGEGGPAVE